MQETAPSKPDTFTAVEWKIIRVGLSTLLIVGFFKFMWQELAFLIQPLLKWLM